jgi:hypothetical protein
LVESGIALSGVAVGSDLLVHSMPHALILWIWNTWNTMILVGGGLLLLPLLVLMLCK